MDNVKITPILDLKNEIGEGPHWIEEDASMVYVDIFSYKIRHYYSQTGRNQTAHLEDMGTGPTVGFVIPVEGKKDAYVVGVGRSVGIINWSADEEDDIVKSAKPILEIDVGLNTRINDAKCGPCGRLFLGTMSVNIDVGDKEYFKGALYSVDADLKSILCVPKVTLSNGLGWSPDNRTMYYIDSFAFHVYAFDYCTESGKMSNKRILLDFKKVGLDSIPDGMTVDLTGKLWIACFSGSEVLCVHPNTGQVIHHLRFSCPNITSCVFGGQDYSTLYVTSGYKYVDDLPKYPESGKTFAVTGLGVQGMPSVNMKIKDSVYPM